MYLKFLKITSVVFLLALFWQTGFAQELRIVNSDAESLIKQYEQGQRTNFTFEEKQIISEYLGSIQKKAPYREQVLSPDATIFFEEDFTQTLMFDNFDFTGLLSDNGWDAHSGAGNNQISTTTGLTYTDYFGSGVGNAALIGAYSSSAEDVNRGFTEQNTNGDVVYYSCLVNVTDDSLNKAGTYFMMLGDRVSPTSFTSFSARVFTKIESDAVYFGLSNTSTPTYGTTAFAKNTTYLLIVKYTINTGGADETKLWVVSSGIPADEVAAGTPEVTNTTTNGQDVIDAFALRQSGATQAETVVDGIRVGKTWSDIFPSTVPPVGWTNVDNGITSEVWEFNNPGGRAISGSNFDADFAILDSDNYGSGTSQDATLTTIAVDCGTATNVSLGFDHQFRAISGSYGIVEVSNDGATWTQLDSISSAGYPNPAVYAEYDITTIAAGQSTVYVRWTYVGSYSWWWAIDNVIIYEPDATPLPAVVVNPLDAEVDVLPSTTLDWVAGGGAAPTGYRLYFGTDGGGVTLPTSIENNTDLGNVTQYTPASVLTVGTTYYWSLVPYNLAGDATGNPIWSFTVLTPYAQPYSQDFNDGTADGWLTTGFGIFNNHGTLGSYAASKNFWSSATIGWVQTPIVGPLTATSQLEFDYRIVNYSGYPGTATVITTDTFKIQISTDFGATFSNVYIIDASNHVSSTNFATVVVDLGSYSGQNVIARWDGKWGAGDYYFDIDNVKLREPPVVPIFSINPTSKAFGDVLVGSSSADQTFTITNTGAGTLTITSGNISIVGGDAGQFTLTDVNTYPINLTTGQSATVDVNFSPTSAGAKTADLQIVDNTTLDVTHTVPLTGTGFDAVSTFSENFDAVTTPALPQYWAKVGAGGSANTQTTNPFSTPNCLYIYSSSTSSLAVVSMPPVDNAGAGTYRLSFKARANFTVGGVIEVGYLTDPNDANTFVSVGSQTISSLTYDDYFVDPGIAPGSNQFLAFRHTGSPANSVLIDDVEWALAPAGAPNPAVLVSPPDAGTDVSDLATLNWSPGGGAPTTGYRINFGTDNPPTNIENNTDLGLVTTYIPSSLAYSTTYYWEIIPYNGSGNASGTSVWSFTTLDDPTITTFPYVEGFEGGTFPPVGWTTYGDKLWTAGSEAHTGTGSARISYSPAGTGNLQTPPVVLPASPDFRIKFWWKDDDISTRPVVGGGPEIVDHDTTYFEVTSDGGSTWMVLTFLSEASPQTSYVEVVEVLSTFAGQTVSFRWRDVSDGSLSAYGTGLDDITIEEVPAAPIFLVTPTSNDFGVLISGNTSAPQDFIITNNGAGTLTITAGSLTGANTDQFMISTETYPINLGPSESDTVSVTFAPTSSGAKTANLEFVHNTTGSPAVIPLTGTALPAGILFEDFTGTTFPPPGWLAINNDAGTKTWVRNTSKFKSSPASASSNWESSAVQNNDWLITPKLSVVSGDSLTFWHSSNGFVESLVIKVGLTNDPNGTWTDLDSLIDDTSPWKYESYDLSAYNGQNVYIAFVNRGLDQFTLYIDDVLGPLVYVEPNDIGVTAYAQPTTENAEFLTGLSRDYVEKDPAFANELQKVSISINPMGDNLSSEAPINFQVIVQNFGALAQNSYQVGWEIDGTMQTSVNNSEPLDVGDVDTLTLTWAVPVAGIHSSRAWTILVGDTNPDNDTSGTISFYAVPDNSVFLEGFEDATFPPAGWLTVNQDGGGVTGPWFQGNPTVFPALTGDGYAGDNYNSANGFYIDDYLITPNTGGSSTDTDSLVFWMRSPDGSTFPDSVEIRVSTTGTDVNDFTILLAYIEVPITGWTRFAYELPNATDRYIAFRYLIYDGGPSGNNSNYIGLDLVEIQRHTSGSTFAFNVSVNDGWNMVSVPGLNPVNQNVETWWSGKDPAAGVFKYDGGYTQVTTATPSEGYWMKNSGAQMYNYSGIQIVAHSDVPLALGWNLIGLYENTVAVPLTTTPPGIITTGIFEYSGGYTTATSLVPGYGYWVKADAAGAITGLAAPPLGKGNGEVVEYFREDWGKIILTDATGINYTLYAVKGQVDLDKYELPPMPPAGMFDIRFGSGRIAEDLNNSIQEIQMSGVTYPLTVRVEGMDMRLMDQSGKIINVNLKSGEDVVIADATIQKLMVTGELIPAEYALEQNYPNPFNPSTVIEFSLPEDVSNVQLSIYNVLGEKVAEIVNSSLTAGKYSYQWNAKNIATGMYIYELRTDKFVSVKKMLLLK